MSKSILPLFVALLGGIVTFVLLGVPGLINFEVGFVSFLLVFLAIFIAFDRKLCLLSSQLKGMHQEEILEKKEEPEGSENLHATPSSFQMGISLSFSFFRILAYTVLIFLLFGLYHFDLFHFYPYIIGIALSGLSIVAVLGFSLRSQG